MPSKAPSDLINQSQIKFRELAGLSSFNPQHPTLKSLPTVQNSISALDPSPSRFRCKHCEEKLLRGSQSLICIYCGQCQAKDLSPEPILFNSTTGYRLLLQSLNLNASEMIEPLVEEKRSNKAGTPAEGVKALSELLDVKIIWPDALEIPDTSYVNKMLDHSSSLHFSRVFSDNFEQMDSGSDASEEHADAISSKDDEIGGFEGEDNLSLFQKSDVPETSAMSSDLSGERDAEIQPSISSPQNEDSLSGAVNSSEDYSKSTADLNREFSSGNEEEIQYVNEDSKTASVSFDLSENDTEIQVVNSNEDLRDIAADLRRNSSSEDDTAIQVMNSNEDSKDIAADLRRNSSSEDETEIQLMNTDSKTSDISSNPSDDDSSGHEATVNSRAQIDDFEAIANVLTRDSSGDDIDIQSKAIFVPFDLSGDDVEIQPVDPNQDSKSDSSSGDEKDMKQNEDLKTPPKSSSSSDDGHDGEIQFVKHDSSSGDENSRISKISAMPNDDVHGAEVHPEDSKPTSGDLSRDSSSGDDTEIQSMNTDSKTADISLNKDSRADSSSGDDTEIQSMKEDLKTPPKSSNSSDDGHDAEIQFVKQDDSKTTVDSSSSSGDEDQNSRIQNEDSKKTADMSSNSSDDKHEVDVNIKTQNEDIENTVNDLNKDSSSGDDIEIQSVNSKKPDEDSKTATISSKLSDHGSFGNDAEISRAQNEDDKAKAAMSSYMNREDSSSGDETENKSLKKDSSSGDESVNSKSVSISFDLSSHDVETHPVDLNKDSKPDSSSGDDIETNSTTHNQDHSKTTVDSRISNSSEDEESIEIHSRAQNDDSKPTTDRDSSSSGDESSRTLTTTSAMNDDSKTTTNMTRDSSSGDETENPNNRTSTATTVSFDLHGHDTETESLNSRRWNQDSRSKASSSVYHDFSADGGSSGDEFQSGISRWNSTAISSDFRTDDSSSGDDAQPHLRTQNHDFTSLHHDDNKAQNDHHPAHKD
ncbi:hypothetical protein LXL04_017566 [Taraxacum kok-saghyz]